MYWTVRVNYPRIIEVYYKAYFSRNNVHNLTERCVNIMAKFNAEDISALASNPYVASIDNNDHINFTEKFKELVTRELLKGEKNIRRILEEHGISPRILGEARIRSFSRRLQQNTQIKNLDEEQQAMLSNNPYVLSFQCDKNRLLEIRFTEEFKELATRELLKGEKTMRQIFKDYGFDPDSLGSRRIDCFTAQLRAKLGETKIQEGQQAMLRNNPYVLSFQCDKNRLLGIRFTEEFKELATRELLKGEKTMRQIFKDYGFDPKVLGGDRIRNCAHLFRVRANQLLKNSDEIVYNERQIIKKAVINNMETTNSKSICDEERMELLSNPHVLSVTDDAIQFTENFKGLAYKELLNGEKTMQQIFQENGIDPKVLGDRRIWNFTARLHEKARAGKGFEDARIHNKRQSYSKPSQEKTLLDRIADLEHELAYARQEVEFLKKNQMADMEARILWESKHRRK